MLSLSIFSTTICAGQVSSYYKRKKGKAEQKAPEGSEGHGRRTWISAASREKPSGYGTSNRTKLLPVSGRSTNLSATLTLWPWGLGEALKRSMQVTGHWALNMRFTCYIHLSYRPMPKLEMRASKRMDEHSNVHSTLVTISDRFHRSFLGLVPEWGCRIFSTTPAISTMRLPSGNLT